MKSIFIRATAFSRHLEHYFKTKLFPHLFSLQRVSTIDLRKQLLSYTFTTFEIKIMESPELLESKARVTLTLFHSRLLQSMRISLWNWRVCSTGMFMLLDWSASSRGWSTGAMNGVVYAGTKEIITLPE